MTFIPPSAPAPASTLAQRPRASYAAYAAYAARVALLMALVLSLAAAFDLVEADVTAMACGILLLVNAGLYGAAQTDAGRRLGEPAWVAAQVASSLLLLAWLAYRTDTIDAILLLLYPVALLPGVLYLNSRALGALAVLALVSLGGALLATLPADAAADYASIVAYLAVLGVVLAFLAWTAGHIERLRAGLADLARDQTQRSRLAALAASRDELTGAFSERQVMDTLAREMARAKRLAAPLCIARVDIDNFSAINVAHGFATGDAVLARFTALANEVARYVDSLGRVGGTEFLLLLPDTAIDNARVAAERLRHAVTQLHLPELPDNARITCSIGITQYLPDEALVTFFERAEGGLNLAKASGRNRVIALAADGLPLAEASA